MPSESVYDLRIRGLRRIRQEEWSRNEIDPAIGELARLQYGVVARWQLLDAGVDKRAIERRLVSGRLHLLHSGIYAVGHSRVPKEGWWLAAVLSTGPAAVLSHHSAAAFWSLRSYTERVVEVTAPHKSTSSKQVRRHVSHLPADERTVEEGIPALLREAEFRRTGGDCL